MMNADMTKTALALSAAAALALAGAAEAQSRNFHVFLSGEEEVPPVTTETTGEALFHSDRSQTVLDFSLRLSDADEVFGMVGAHLHCAPAGVNGPVVVFLAGQMMGGLSEDVQVDGTLTGDNIVNDLCGETIAELIASMRAGMVYVNVHSNEHPGGVVRGQVD